MTTEKYLTFSIFLILVPAIFFLSLTIMPKRTQRYLESHKSIPVCILLSLVVLACIWCVI